MALTPQQEHDLAPVVYEWNMLVGAAERLAPAPVAGDPVLSNLVLEAFIVHFRQLGDFFFGSPEKGDLHVGQFIGGRSWRAVTGRKNRWNELLVRASKQVAHLTAERHFKQSDVQKQQWPVSRLVSEVAEELQAFCGRTGFSGFPGIGPSTKMSVVDPERADSNSAEQVVSTTTAPTICNSVAVNQTLGGRHT